MSPQGRHSTTEGERRAVALDVGGTNVRAGVVDGNARVLGTPREVPSPTGESYEAILDTFERLIRDAMGATTVAALGVAIPGPFDYEAGTSHMSHKFIALRDQPLGADLVGRLSVPVCFLNDADAFALGAWATEFRDVERFLGVTLGTGVGTGFVVGGRLAGAAENAPPDREIWYTPYGDGVLEDEISKRGIERAYLERGGHEDRGVRQIAAAARAGDEAASETLRALGATLGDGLALAAGAFRPDVVAFGGKISLAYDVFGTWVAPAFAARAGYEPSFAPSHASEPALRGAGHAALHDVAEGLQGPHARRQGQAET